MPVQLDPPSADLLSPDEFDTRESEARTYRDQQRIWNDAEAYTAADFLDITLRQMRDFAQAQRAWHERFEADQKRVEEWRFHETP